MYGERASNRDGYAGATGPVPPGSDNLYSHALGPGSMGKAEQLVFPGRERVEDRRRERQHSKLLDEFFDHATLVTISRLVNQGQFDTLDYPISTGKEGGVFRATKGEEFRAVKIYRIGNSTFRNLPPYALEELRRETSVRNYGGLVYAWTRREHTMLGRLKDAGVRVPTPYGHYRNVLVMEFVGTEEGGAPRFVQAQIDDPAAVYADLVAQLDRMVRTARVVHGDLSPYNTLLFRGESFIIDVAQAVPIEHPQARALLERDVTNFAKFFRRLGLDLEAHEFLAAAGGDALPTPAAGG
jgi:RIO kinase 1